MEDVNLPLNGHIRMIFTHDPFMPASIGVLLCEMSGTLRGREVIMEPKRVVTKWELADVNGDEVRPLFHVSRFELVELANALARIGVFADVKPKATDDQLTDLRHNRDHLEGVTGRLLDLLNKGLMGVV